MNEMNAREIEKNKHSLISRLSIVSVIVGIKQEIMKSISKERNINGKLRKERIQ